MNKIVFAIVGLVMATMVMSCEKEYTCTCVYPGATIGTTKTTIKAKKKADAEATCNAQNTGAKANGGSCAL